MKMQQIRYFLALCDELNFRGAAKRSGVSQPTLTNAIAALERKLGGALLERKPQVALTPLGRALLPHLQSIVERADRVTEIARPFDGDRGGESMA